MSLPNIMEIDQKDVEIFYLNPQMSTELLWCQLRKTRALCKSGLWVSISGRMFYKPRSQIPYSCPRIYNLFPWFITLMPHWTQIAILCAQICEARSQIQTWLFFF